MKSLKVVIASASVSAINAFIRCVSEIAVLDIPRRVTRDGEEAESSLMFGRLAQLLSPTREDTGKVRLLIRRSFA